jgi:hypothetical protein
MADQPKEKSLEMRVAELEDKLSKMHVTEDEMKAFQKVSSLMGGAPMAGGAEPIAGAAAQAPQSIVNCIVRTCIIRTCIIRTCIINCIITCINECNGCVQGGGGMLGGSGFGGLGM